MAIASSAKERHGGRKGQDVLWVGSDRWRRAFASECYGAALGRGREGPRERLLVDSAVLAVSAQMLLVESVPVSVWESETLAGWCLRWQSAARWSGAR
jgi:hypothetical protein